MRSRSSIVVQGRMVVRSVFEQRGFWFGRIRDKVTGRVYKFSTRLKSTQKNLPNAKRKLVEYAEALIASEALKKDLDVVRFDRAFEEWLSLKNIRPSTRREYMYDYEATYKPAFGCELVHQIRPKDIEKFLAQLDRKGKSASTIKKHLR